MTEVLLTPKETEILSGPGTKEERMRRVVEHWLDDGRAVAIFHMVKEALDKEHTRQGKQ